MTATTRKLIININGTRHELDIDPRTTLLDLLRERIGLTGTKKGCNRGECGACTVLAEGKSINSCLAVALSYNDRIITTIEGLSEGDAINSLQQAFIDYDAFQCGFCTPGQIMSGTACIAAGHANSDADVSEWMSGNICRCSAYPQIVEAIRSVAKAKTMQPFDYIRAKSIDHAINEASSSPSMFLAGGTELLNWMRIGIRTPKRVIDITGVSELSEIHRCGENGVRIGALVTLNQVAEAEEIIRDFPVLSQAVRKSASSQLRNMATIGGNPLQLPRCPYFRADPPVACNRRIAGSGCAALSGFNERHAIFGYDDFCVATHPSDPAVALAVLDAVVVTASARGERRIRLEEFFKYSRSEPYSFSVLADDEIITSFELPTPAPNSAYLKVRERESYEYALVSSAVSLKMHGGVIEEARVALGSVSHKPWRLNATEARLRGLRCDSAAVSAAVDAGLQEARALPSNAYKIVLARNATIRTIKLAAGTR